MIYTSYQDLANCIRRNLWKVPADVDLIVGVPRSGMIPALMIAELLNKRCATLDEFIEGRVMSCGSRGAMLNGEEIAKVLVVDDTVYKGKELKSVRERLITHASQYQVLFATIYAESAGAKDMVDIYFEDTSHPGDQIFIKEWNVTHLLNRHTKRMMWDIDGLLSKDPPDDHDQAKYEAYLPNALPMIIPTTFVGAFVTYRLEKYRTVTEAWLQHHDIHYGQLIMFPSQDREERNHTQSPARFKARQYAAATWAQLFYESEQRQAERIHRLTGKPVFCYENGKMYQ